MGRRDRLKVKHLGIDVFVKLDNFHSMRLILSLVIGIFAMLFALRPLPFNSVIHAVRSRVTGLPQRLPLTLLHVKMRSFSDHPVGEPPALVPDFSQCKSSDRDVYRRILINGDSHNLDYTFKLLMNMVRQPCLGHLVERVEYVHRPTNFEDWPGSPYQRELSTDDLDLLKRAVGNAGFKDGKEHRIMSMLMQNTLDQDLSTTKTGCWWFQYDAPLVLSLCSRKVMFAGL